jgi:hypothetical protein
MLLLGVQSVVLFLSVLSLVPFGSISHIFIYYTSQLVENGKWLGLYASKVLVHDAADISDKVDAEFAALNKQKVAMDFYDIAFLKSQRYLIVPLGMLSCSDIVVSHAPQAPA